MLLAVMVLPAICVLVMVLDVIALPGVELATSTLPDITCPTTEVQPDPLYSYVTLGVPTPAP